MPVCASPADAKSVGGGSALKIVLTAVGVISVLGGLSIGGMYYAAHRYIKMAENVTGIHARMLCIPSARRPGDQAP